MNTEFRNKILNRYVESAEKENTQEQQAFLQAREKVDEKLVALVSFLFLHVQHTYLKFYF